MYIYIHTHTYTPTHWVFHNLDPLVDTYTWACSGAAELYCSVFPSYFDVKILLVQDSHVSLSDHPECTTEVWSSSAASPCQHSVISVPWVPGTHVLPEVPSSPSEERLKWVPEQSSGMLCRLRHVACALEWGLPVDTGHGGKIYTKEISTHCNPGHTAPFGGALGGEEWGLVLVYVHKVITKY